MSDHSAKPAAVAAAKAAGHDAPPKKRRLLRAGMAGTAAVLMVGGVTWYFIAPVSATPTDRLHEALKHIDAGALEEARAIAKELEADGFNDEAFPGGVEYVLGMAEFLSLTDALEEETPAIKAAVISYLKEAEHQGLAEGHQLSWAFALGSCLETTGQSTAAQPLLEEVASADGPNRHAAAALLIDLYLDPTWSNPERLARAFELNTVRLKAIESKTPEAESAVLEHAAVQLALGHLTEAETAITHAELDATSPGVLLMRGRILMAAERLPDAIATLEKIPVDETGNDNVYRQALYLMGTAAQRQAIKLEQATAEGMQKSHNAADRNDYRQRAVEYYRKVINTFRESDESLAAGLMFGRMELSTGAHEKALQLFGMSLRAANRQDEFRNRWLSLDVFREGIREAWVDWMEAERYAEAIALTDLMTPVFPRDQAYELSAMAYRGWADKADREFAKASATQRAERLESLQQLFGDTGAAYDRLAQAHRSSEHAREAMWLAVDFYRRGRNFATALTSVERFLEHSSKTMQPVAMVRKGQILLDLDRVGDAEAAFKQVLKDYPTSAAIFQAQYLLGVCRLEQDDARGAAEHWKAITTTDRLAPTAVEWRDALLALAKLHTETAAWSRRQLERSDLNPQDAEQLWNDVAAKSSEAAKRLYEFLARYPNAKDVAEARYHLGKSMQLLGDCRQRDWLAAETENARAQTRQQLNEVLVQALDQFQQLRDELTAEFQADQLDPIRRQIWENVWFEYPHTLCALQRYDEAIAAYSAAMHRFPQDVRVLTAHVQMAYAYAQLDRLPEARSLLEQAKVILVQNQIPADSFKAPTTNLTPTEWEQWLDRVRQVYR
jgi:tetratricopeptide (TPR) repeat protein